MIAAFVETIFAAKNFAVTATGLTRDGLHFHVSVILLLLFALPFGRKLASIGPLLLVLLAEVLNEWVDFRLLPPGAVPAYFWPEVAKDVVNSMLLPFLLFLIARYAPWWLGIMPTAKQRINPLSDEAT